MRREDGKMTNDRKERLDSLDGLKVLFCILIFSHHYWGGVTNYGQQGLAPFENIFHFIYANGALGVEFFFIVSGFVMTYNYKTKIKDIPSNVFLLKRMSKLVPVAVLSVIVGFLLSMINNNLGYELTLVNKPISVPHLIMSLLFVNNGWFVNSFNAYGSGTWFLDVLLLCYIVWLFVGKLVKTNKQYTVVCALLAIVGFACMHFNLDIPFLYATSGRGYFNFFFGCLLCQLLERKRNYVWICTTVGLIFGVSTKNIALLFSTVLCPTLIYIALYIKPAKKVLSSKLFKKCVPYTMCIYLTHVLIIAGLVIMDRYFLLGIPFNNIFVMLTIFGICFLVAIGCHFAIELPAYNRMAHIMTKNNR